MSIVKINAVTVPPDKQERFEERFRGRAGAVTVAVGRRTSCYPACGPVDSSTS